MSFIRQLNPSFIRDLCAAAKARRSLSVFLLIGFLILTSSPNADGRTAALDEVAQDNLHGGIEIDSDGIKAAVIRIGGEQSGGGQIVYTEASNTVLRREADGKFAPEMIKATSQAVLELQTR